MVIYVYRAHPGKKYKDGEGMLEASGDYFGPVNVREGESQTAVELAYALAKEVEMVREGDKGFSTVYLSFDPPGTLLDLKGGRARARLIEPLGKGERDIFREAYVEACANHNEERE